VLFLKGLMPAGGYCPAMQAIVWTKCVVSATPWNSRGIWNPVEKKVKTTLEFFKNQNPR
jgi:hypothetical protein